MKKLILTLFGVLAAVCSLCAQPKTQSLTVVVTNMETTEGLIKVTLFDSEDSWLDKGELKKTTIQSADKVTVVFENVPTGTYAVSVTHDENNNGRMDANGFGMPTERYGFSNNARNMFGPASFEDSSFDLNGDKTIEIKIK